MGQSINQVRHFYYLEDFTTVMSASNANLLDFSGVFSMLDKAGIPSDLFVKSIDNTAYGNITRSTLIPIKNILSVSSRAAADMVHKLKVVKITLDSTVNGGAPVAGQDYILNIMLRNYVGLGEEDTYLKFGLAHAYSGMTAAQFYAVMALSLAKNIGREAATPFSVVLGITGDLTTDTDAVPVESNSKLSSLTGAYTCIYLVEAVQPWILGVMPEQYIGIYPTCNNITVDGSEVQWATIASSYPGKTAKIPNTTLEISNSHNVADLEYFCAGAKGDDYRMMGYPNVIRTTYSIDPTTAGYDLIDIHYYDDLDNQSVQKSEKTVTIALDSGRGATLATNLDVVFKAALGHNLFNKSA